MKNEREAKDRKNTGEVLVEREVRETFMDGSSITTTYEYIGRDQLKRKTEVKHDGENVTEWKRTWYRQDGQVDRKRTEEKEDGATTKTTTKHHSFDEQGRKTMTETHIDEGESGEKVIEKFDPETGERRSEERTPLHRVIQ